MHATFNDSIAWLSHIEVLSQFLLCRDLTNPELASKFLTIKPNNEGYFRHDTVVVAPKTTIAAGSMVGKHSKIGEKCTIKRSVVGMNCSIGNHVKLLNSVLMDRVAIEDGCVVQNCILCSGAQLQVGSQDETLGRDNGQYKLFPLQHSDLCTATGYL